MNRQERDPVFDRRFARHEEELRWLYCELYRNDRQAYEALVLRLQEAWSQRGPKLRTLDLAREACPDWYRGHELVGMQLYVDSFAGTLAGMRKKLDYLVDCGVNYVHLMSLLCSPPGRSDGGYAVSDFRSVRPDLGTMADLEALAEACHEQGISLCVDFCLNHTSEDHPWAQKARAGDPAYQRRYFFYDSWDIPNWYDQTVPQVFPATAPGNFTWCPEAGKIVLTTFFPYQWDLNYANPLVFNDMVDNLLFLCNRGVDVIRLDTLPYIWKTLGTSCRNLPQVHTLVRMLRMICEIVCPGVLLSSEVVLPPHLVAPYFGTVEKPECHLLYNVSTMAALWHTVATRDTRLLSHQLRRVFALPRPQLFLNYVRCHDDIGWGLDYDDLASQGMSEKAHKKFLNDFFTGAWPGSRSRGELYNEDPRQGDARLCGTTASLCGLQAAREARDAEGTARALTLDLMLHAFILTLSGLPVLYGGDEIGQENDDSYHADPLKREDARYLHRGKMDWKKAAKRAHPRTPEARLFSGLRQMEEIRARYVVFDDTADVWLLQPGDNQLLGIGRYCRGEKLLALFNFGERPHTAWIHDESRYTDLLTGEELTAGSVRVPGGTFRWLYQDMNSLTAAEGEE